MPGRLFWSDGDGHWRIFIIWLLFIRILDKILFFLISRSSLDAGTFRPAMFHLYIMIKMYLLDITSMTYLSKILQNNLMDNEWKMIHQVPVAEIQTHILFHNH